MPELPEVETVTRGLQPYVEGVKIASVQLRRADLRIPFPDGMEQLLTGAVIAQVSRRAKYVLLTLDNGWVWVVHLGMSGTFTVKQAGYAPQKHDHVLVALDSGVLLVFNDPRRFGLMDLVRDDALGIYERFTSLGPEPLSNAFNGAYLAEKMTGRRTLIKPWIMDNRFVVGVGNIYASESLWRAKIHPMSVTGECVDKAELLVGIIREVLSDAIEAGGSTLKDFASAEGNAGCFQHNFDVYGRDGKPCNRCDGQIERVKQAGRASFFCAGCQR